MPRDTIRRLSSDLERVLIAGAHLAAGDAGLAKDRTALDGLAAQLGAKAPVIGQLAAATGKAIVASGADAARELVGLATMTAQVRAAQAQLAPSPVHTALPPRPEIGTPCNAKELGELYTALVETGKGRMQLVQQAIERGDIADLRLAEALIYAMGDGYIGDLVAERAVPRLGPAIVAPIRANLDFEKSRKIDGRRLRALVAVDAEGSRDLLQRALAEGNAELREAALDAIADHICGDPAFEKAVLALIAKERSGGVFRAALRALAGYASDATLEALTAALDDDHTVNAAVEGLGRSRHPKALECMLQRLADAVAAAAKAASANQSAKQQGAGKPAGNAVAPAELVSILLRALGKRADPRVAAAAMPLIDEYRAVAAEAALLSADPGQLAVLADFLAGDDSDLFAAAAAAAVKLGPEQAFKRLSAAFTAKDRGTKPGLARLEAVAEQLSKPGSLDQRWAEVCLGQLDGPVAIFAIRPLGLLKERRALKPLLAIVTAEKQADLLAAALEALGRLGDPASIPAILAHHGSKEWRVRRRMQEAVMEINDPAAVDQVRSLWVSLEQPTGYEHWHLRNLLQHLERRFPGK